MAMRKKTSLDDKTYKESLEQEHGSREMCNGKEENDDEGPQISLKKCLQVDVQKESLPQANISLHHPIVKEESHE